MGSKKDWEKKKVDTEANCEGFEFVETLFVMQTHYP